MSQFISDIERSVVSTSGHIIEFSAGVPTHVPPEAERDVLAAGCTPVEPVVEPAADTATV